MLCHQSIGVIAILTVVNRDSNPEEPRVLTLDETDIFLETAQHYRYFNTFSLALETGMRIGDDHVIIRLKLDKPSKYAGLS